MARVGYTSKQLAKATAVFVANPNCAKALGLTHEMRVLAEVRADEAAKQVRAIAPVGDSEPGKHYRDMIEPQVRILRGRYVGRVAALKWTAKFLEFGTLRMRARAPLRRGTEMSGLRVEDRGRRRRG